MKLPNQSLPVVRDHSEVSTLDNAQSITPSENLFFQCQQCCALGGSNCSSIPNCDCSNINYV